ncbi:hypothetical protein [Spiroplasma citri]|nr:hypothetical protein [Spiroplasma citri]
MGKIPYDLSLYSATGRVYLTDVSTGANTKLIVFVFSEKRYKYDR